jgi:hypothetical protein
MGKEGTGGGEADGGWRRWGSQKRMGGYKVFKWKVRFGPCTVARQYKGQLQDKEQDETGSRHGRGRRQRQRGTKTRLGMGRKRMGGGRERSGAAKARDGGQIKAEEPSGEKCSLQI